MEGAVVVVTIVLLTVNVVISTLSFIFTHVRRDDDKK